MLRISLAVCFLFLSSCIYKSFCNSTCHLTECSIRYEITNETHSIWGYKSCTDVFDYACICSKPIDVLYRDFPPYIYKDSKTKEIIGIFPGILNEAFKACCFGCTKVNYLKPYTTSAEAISKLTVATISVPLISLSGSKTFLDATFIELFATRGAVYVTVKEMNLEQFSKFYDSIVSNWPLFFISLLLAVDAGVLVWLLDCWNNKEEFPMEFRKGVVEGLWWAYVTMTTVGYGDKTPKSLLARILAIMWITVGISLSGIFTASLTTGMTQSLNEGELSLNGKKVGVTNHTRYEIQIALREGANIVVHNSYEELKFALKNKSVDGILLDSLVLSHFYTDLQESIKDLHIRTDAIKNSKTSYGLVFPYDHQNTTKKAWSTFLKTFFYNNQDNMDVLMHLAKSKLTFHPIPNSAKAGQLSIFNSPTIYRLMFKYIGLATLILFVLGFFFEKIRLSIKMYIASRQDKWSSKVEAETAKPEVGQEQSESLSIDITSVKLREKFQVVMQEIEIEEGNVDYSKVVRKVLEKVFSYNIPTHDFNDARTNKVPET